MKTVFMDLQGTLGGDPLASILDFDFYPGAIEALKILKAHKYRMVIVTNQSKIAGGHLSQECFDEISHGLLAGLDRDHGLHLELYCCPHSRAEGCLCKKPKRGLYDMALERGPVAIKESYMIGDMGKSDMAFAHGLGMKKILVKTGVGLSSLTTYRHTWQGIQEDYLAEDILHAVQWLVDENRQKK